MIVVRVIGGLGNQFFQYAAAKSLAIRHGTSIGIDTTFFKGNDGKSHFRRKFGLGQFDTVFKKMALKDIKKYVWISGNKYLDKYLRKISVLKKGVWHDNGAIGDFDSQSSDVYLDGHFINPKYFGGLKNTLQKEFELRNKNGIHDFLKKINSSDSVSIHVRRGDLLKLKGSYILPKDYYSKAIKIISGKVKNPKFFIFSDDITWCREHFKNFENKVFVDGNGVAEDFELMKNCKHNILANSTLSWWVGYLNPNNNPIVVAPEHFCVLTGLNPKIQLSEWIVI
jgi:hypothetical protein